MSMQHTDHIKLLYGLVLLLLLSMVGVVFFFSTNRFGATSLSQNRSALNPSHVSASTTTPDLSGVIVGGGGPAIINVIGTITSLSNGLIKVKVFNQNKVDTVVINAGTKFEIIGQDKDPATIHNELTAYNTRVN